MTESVLKLFTTKHGPVLVNHVPQRRPKGTRFVQVQETWLTALAPMGANTRWLAVILLWRSFKCRSTKFVCSSLEQFGITPKQKSRGLRELERAGLVQLELAGPGRSPRVTILPPEV